MAFSINDREVLLFNNSLSEREVLNESERARKVLYFLDGIPENTAKRAVLVMTKEKIAALALRYDQAVERQEAKFLEENYEYQGLN